MLKKILNNKELLWTVFAQALQMTSGVVLIKLLTSNLSLEGYGTFSLVMAASAFVLTLPFSAFQQGFYRYRSTYLKKGKGEDFYSSMIYGLVALIIIYILLAYGTTRSFFEKEVWHTHFPIIALFISTEVIKIYVRAIVNADRNRKLYSFAIVAEFSTKLVFVWCYFILSIIDEFYIFLLYSISNMISILICMRGYLINLKLINWVTFYEVWKKTLTFSTPLLIWAVFGWSRDSSLRWFIEAKLGTSDVAVFTAITSIGVIIPLALQSLVSAYIIPILYQKDEGKSREKLDEKFSYFIRILYMIGIIGFAFLYMFSEVLVGLLTDSKYVGYAWSLPWVFISYYLFCCAMINATTLLVNYDTKSLLYPNLLSGVATPIIVLLAGEKFSLKLAISAYAISYLIYFSVTTIIVYKSRLKGNDNIIEEQ